MCAQYNKNIVMYYGANKVYSIRVYDDNGQVVGAGENVVISIAGENVNVNVNPEQVLDKQTTLIVIANTAKLGKLK